MRHVQGVTEESKEVDYVADIFSHLWSWTIPPSPIPPSIRGIDFSPTNSGTYNDSGLNAALLPNKDLLEQVVDVCGAEQLRSSNIGHTDDPNCSTISGIFDVVPEFPLSTRTVTEEAPFSLAVENCSASSTYNDLDVLSVSGTNHFHPPLLDESQLDIFQTNNNDKLEVPCSMNWGPEITPNNAFHRLYTPSTLPSENWLTPVADGRNCMCQYTQTNSLNTSTGIYHPKPINHLRLDDDQQQAGEGRNHRQRHRAYWTTLPFRNLISTHGSSQGMEKRNRVETPAVEQELQSSMIKANRLEELLQALDDNGDGLSVLLRFLRPTSTNTTSIKHNNVRNHGRGVQTYICLFNHCGKRLERRDRALGHVRMHLGFRPYACNGECGVNGCKEAFACRSYLKSHRKRPKETCSRCGVSLFKKDFLRHTLFCHST